MWKNLQQAVFMWFQWIATWLLTSKTTARIVNYQFTNHFLKDRRIFKFAVYLGKCSDLFCINVSDTYNCSKCFYVFSNQRGTNNNFFKSTLQCKKNMHMTLKRKDGKKYMYGVITCKNNKMRRYMSELLFSS